MQRYTNSASFLDCPIFAILLCTVGKRASDYRDKGLSMYSIFRKLQIAIFQSDYRIEPADMFI
jgi:hypothetical protein